MATHPPRLAVITIGVVILASGPGAAASPQMAEGPWRAWLDCPGGDLPFDLHIARDEDGVRAWISNGDERMAVPDVRFDEDEWLFDIDHYDAYLRGALSNDGTRLDGVWRRRLSQYWAELPFHATAGRAPRFATDGEVSAEQAPLERRWAAQFAMRSDPSVALFDEQAGGTVKGTFLNTSGDYRYLAGTFAAGRLRLSRFDGAHAFLFDARIESDGTLSGAFWEGNYLEDSWRAHPDSAAQLDDPFASLELPERIDFSTLVFYDFEGKPCSFSEPRFQKPLLLVEILGTWCPNCHDASRFLVELQREFGDKGLQTIGLAFEMTGDFARNVQFVRRYQKRHAIEYPLLLASTDVRTAPSEFFPPEKGEFAFPTILFLGGDGTVHAAYKGFSGAATGEEHDRMKSRFRALIDDLLSHTGGAGPR